MSVVERPFLHMLPEVDSLPDVKGLRLNIDSSYDLFTRGPASASESICASGWSVENLRFNISVHAEDSPSHKLC